MERRTLIDKLDALANGTLASDEAERLRERCDSDPELRALLENYLEVHAMTECLTDAPPPCRLDYAEVEGAAGRPWRVVLRRSLRIAAAVLVLVGGGLLLSQLAQNALRGNEGTGRSAEVIALRAVPVSPEEVEPSDVGTPEMLASYRPVEEGEIRWIESFDTARAVARLSSRPVLLFIYHPTCPWCIELRDGTFTDPDVRTALADFVPTRLSVMTLEEQFRPLVQQKNSWPWLGTVDANGDVLLAFPGLQGPGDLKAKMTESSRLVGPSVASWKRVNEVAALLAPAVEAEEAGHPAEAWALYGALAEDETAGPFAEAARRGRQRIAQSALRALLTAREICTTEGGVASARAVLEEARRQLAGTPLAEDLAAVLESLTRTGRFPALEVRVEADGE